MCGETRDRVGFGPLPQGPRNSPSSSIYTTLRASFRLWVLFKLKFAVAATSRTSFVFNDHTKTSQNPTFINKAFLCYSQYPDCNLSFLLVLRLLAGIDLRGQVDRAPAWSITSGDWFSDC